MMNHFSLLSPTNTTCTIAPYCSIDMDFNILSRKPCLKLCSRVYLLKDVVQMFWHDHLIVGAEKQSDYKQYNNPQGELAA